MEGRWVYALTCKYYLTYTAYGLSCGMRDPNLLSDNGKKHLLKARRPRGPSKVLIEEDDDDVAESSSKRARLEDDSTPQ